MLHEKCYFMSKQSWGSFTYKYNYEQVGDAMFCSSLTRLTYVININDISNADKINGDLHSTLNIARRYFIMSELDWCMLYVLVLGKYLCLLSFWSQKDHGSRYLSISIISNDFSIE